MATELTATKPADAFRDGASGLLHAVADMSLHDLVDEFQRLSIAIEDGRIEGEDAGAYRPVRWSDAAQLAMKQRLLVNGAARARFGISFESYDRNDTDNNW